MTCEDEHRTEGWGGVRTARCEREIHTTLLKASQIVYLQTDIFRSTHSTPCQKRRHFYSCSSPILKNARPHVQQPRAPSHSAGRRPHCRRPPPLPAVAAIADHRPHFRPRLCRPQVAPTTHFSSTHPGYHAPNRSLAAAAATGRLYRFWPRLLCMPHLRC